MIHKCDKWTKVLTTLECTGIMQINSYVPLHCIKQHEKDYCQQMKQ